MMNKTIKPTVGLVMKSLAAEFFQNMHAAAVKYARARGDLELVAVGTETQTGVEHQIRLVNGLAAQKVDALVIIPIDSEALVPPVVNAIRNGIRVISSDVMLSQERLVAAGVSIPFVGPDNVLAARLVGDLLARRLGSGSRVVLIDGIPDALNARQRREGFLRSITNNDLVLLKSRDANWETGRAFEVFSEILREHPNIDGVLCANDAMALGVIQAIDSSPVGHGIVTVGIDNDPSIRPYILNDRMLATVDLLGQEMVIRAINLAMEALAGKERRGWLKTPIQVITRESLVQPLV